MIYIKDTLLNNLEQITYDEGGINTKLIACWYVIRVLCLADLGVLESFGTVVGVSNMALPSPNSKSIDIYKWIESWYIWCMLLL